LLNGSIFSRYFFFTRDGLADKVGFFFCVLEIEADFLTRPGLVVTFFAERAQPCLEWSGEDFDPFVFPVNPEDDMDFFFAS
jgi:hypothetical protein